MWWFDAFLGGLPSRSFLLLDFNHRPLVLDFSTQWPCCGCKLSGLTDCSKNVPLTWCWHLSMGYKWQSFTLFFLLTYIPLMHVRLSSQIEINVHCESCSVPLPREACGADSWKAYRTLGWSLGELNLSVHVVFPTSRLYSKRTLYVLLRAAGSVWEVSLVSQFLLRRTIWGVP